MIAAEQANGAPGEASLNWQRFEIPEFGTSVDYPAGIFASSGPSKKGLGRQFDSPDGRTVLSIYSQENTNADTPASYLRNNLRVGQRALDYERVTRSFFAVSMERGGGYLLQPLQFFRCLDHRNSLLRSGLPAGGEGGVGPRRDTH